MNNSEPRRSGVYSTLFLILAAAGLLSFAAFPGLSLDSLSTQYRWRYPLIQLYNGFRLGVGDRVFNQVVIGDQGWWFYTGDTSLYDYQNTDPFKKRTLRDLQKGLGRLNADLEARGITLLLVIPPNKSTVYSRYMPDEVPVIGGISRLDQFIDAVRSETDVRLIDLRPVLIEASRSRDVYYKLDTHWNDLGAYYGYVEIMRALSEDRPALAPRPLTEFQFVLLADQPRDMPQILGVPFVREASLELIPRDRQSVRREYLPLTDGKYGRLSIHPDPSLPRLLVFHDSFYLTLTDFMDPHFSRTLGLLYAREAAYWNLDWVERESPDVVILEFTERSLEGILTLLKVRVQTEP